MDVWEYFQTRDREIAEQSAAWEEPSSPYAEEQGSNGQRGRIFGRVILSDSAFLQVHERVEVSGTGVHRTEYAYFLVRHGAELWGVERDPTHTPALHQHDRHHNRFSCAVISFKDALATAWSIVSAEEDLAETTDPMGTNGH